MKKTIRFPISSEEFQQLLSGLKDENISILEIVSDSHQLMIDETIAIFQAVEETAHTVILNNGCLFRNETQELMRVFENLPQHIEELEICGNLLGWRPFFDIYQLFSKLERLHHLKTLYLAWNEFHTLSYEQMLQLDHQLKKFKTPLYLMRNHRSNQTMLAHYNPNHSKEIGKRHSYPSYFFDTFPLLIKNDFEMQCIVPDCKTISLQSYDHWASFFSHLISLSIPIDFFHEILTHSVRIEMPYLKDLHLYRREGSNTAMTERRNDCRMPQLTQIAFDKVQSKDLQFTLNHESLKRVSMQIETMIFDEVQFQKDDIDAMKILFRDYCHLRRLDFHLAIDTDELRLDEIRLSQGVLMQILGANFQKLTELYLQERGPTPKERWSQAAIERAFQSDISRMIAKCCSFSLRTVFFDLPGYCNSFHNFKNLREISLYSQLHSSEINKVCDAMIHIAQSNIRRFHWIFKSFMIEEEIPIFQNEFEQKIFPLLPKDISFRFEFQRLLHVVQWGCTPINQKAYRILIEDVFPKLPSNVTQIIFRDDVVLGRNEISSLFNTTKNMIPLLSSLPITVRKIRLFCHNTLSKYLPDLDQDEVTRGLKWISELKKSFREGRIDILGFFKEKITDYLFFYMHLFRKSGRYFEQRDQSSLPVPPIALIHQINAFLVEKETLPRLSDRLNHLERHYFQKR